MYIRYQQITIALMILLALTLTSCSDNQIIGGDVDSHGCLIGAGYSWCESKEKCLRTWEEVCPKVNVADAKELCNDAKIEGIYLCNDYIKVVSVVPGVGTTYYRPDLTVVDCQTISYDNMSEECKDLFYNTACSTENLCKGNEDSADNYYSVEECESVGGKIVNIVSGNDCQADEYKMGDIDSLASPSICCYQVKDFYDCVNLGFGIMESYPRQCKFKNKTFVEEV